ncbi:MAG: acyl-ACP--UDP-N-acetylglucosamine O-acyltransferase [Pseudomonadota bacterium]
MSFNIHPSSVVEDGAEIGDECIIGPFCHIGEKVRLGAQSILHSHVALHGNTSIDEGAKIFPFASIGHEPQDLKYSGEDTALDIGKNCTIREGVTMNPGTAGDLGKTIVGDNCVFLANSHVAHDCQIGNGVILSNAALIAGHCKVGNHVIVGGGAGVHQFCRIGDNAFIGGLAGIENDIIPFGLALGNRANLGGLNLIGMKRAGIDRDSIHNTRKAYKILFSKDGNISENLKKINSEFPDDAVVQIIVSFIEASTDRSLCTPR